MSLRTIAVFVLALALPAGSALAQGGPAKPRARSGAARPGAARAATPKRSPKLLVVNKGEDTLAVVDLGDVRDVKAMKVLGKVPTGHGPHEVTSDGALAFVGNYGTQQPGSSLSIIDIAAMKEVKRVELGALTRPHGIMYYDGHVWFSAEGSRAAARYDVAEDRVDWLQGTGQNVSHMIVLTPDRRKAYLPNIGSDSVTVLEQPDNPDAPWKLTQIAVGKGPEGIDVSPDGKEVWVAHRGDGGVSIIDVATDKVVHTLPALARAPIRVKFTPDGKRVLISDVVALGGPPQRGDLVVVDARKRQEAGRIPIGLGPIGIVTAPDGKRAFVAAVAEGKVVVVDLRSMKVIGSVETGAGPDGLWYVP
jgi:YVTN family beta-propeller protein